MGDNWELPKPVFRSSSGSLPQDFVERIAGSQTGQPVPAAPDADDNKLSSLYAPPDELSETIPDHQEPIPSSIDSIEPQPLISEQFNTDEIDTLAPNKPEPKKGGSGSTFFVMGTVVFFAFIAAILALVYFFFFRNPPETTF